MISTKTSANLGFLAIAGLMLATRSHHFGSITSLPDASLVAFFLAGLFFTKLRLFVVLLIEAALIDYLSIGYFAVSDYCISPAYIALIPTYAVMWYAGRYCSKFKADDIQIHSIQFAVLFLATSIAFAISNSSFYLFSGRFTDLSWMQYLERTGLYYIPYLTSTLIYGIVIIATIKLVDVMVSQSSEQDSIV